MFILLLILNTRKALNLESVPLKTNWGTICSMLKSFVKVIPARVKGYVRENWGTPFIVGFILLLMVAVASLSAGLADLANAVAVSAYYALVVGVVLQLACFLKYGEKDGSKN